jgi:hypothetical protein
MASRLRFGEWQALLAKRRLSARMIAKAADFCGQP